MARREKRNRERTVGAAWRSRRGLFRLVSLADAERMTGRSAKELCEDRAVQTVTRIYALSRAQIAIGSSGLGGHRLGSASNGYLRLHGDWTIHSGKGATVLRSYEILLAGNRVAVLEAGTPQMALIDHLRMAGCSDRDIIRLGTHSVAWRGAVYRARLLRTDPREAATDADAGSD